MRTEVERCITQHVDAIPVAFSLELIRAWVKGHAIVGDTAILSPWAAHISANTLPRFSSPLLITTMLIVPMSS
jgi:hypothetical protein